MPRPLHSQPPKGGAALPALLRVLRTQRAAFCVQAAKVAPLAFAGAVQETLEKVLSLPVEREMIISTVESIRLVTKEARPARTSPHVT